LKISVVGDIPDEESYIHLIDTFVKDHKVGTPVIISAGTLNTLSKTDKWAKGKGYDSVILGNVITLAILNGDKVILIWDGENRTYEEALILCKKEKKSYMEIKTK
jgi:hypothetical protein